MIALVEKKSDVKPKAPRFLIVPLPGKVLLALEQTYIIQSAQQKDLLQEWSGEDKAFKLTVGTKAAADHDVTKKFVENWRDTM